METKIKKQTVGKFRIGDEEVDYFIADLLMNDTASTNAQLVERLIVEGEMIPSEAKKAIRFRFRAMNNPNFRIGSLEKGWNG